LRDSTTARPLPIDLFIFDPRGTFFKENNCNKKLFPSGNCDVYIERLPTKTWILKDETELCKDWWSCIETCGKLNGAYSIATTQDSGVCILSGNSNLLCSSDGVCTQIWSQWRLLNFSVMNWLIVIGVTILLVIFLCTGLGWHCGRKKASSAEVIDREPLIQ